MMPSRYLMPKPARSKASAPVYIKHISAPLKGLSLSSKLVQGDPLTASVLDNFVIEENQIRCRAGTLLRLTHADVKPVEHLVPYYGQPNKLAAATNGKLVELDGTLIKGGFTGNDWSWTAFSNLSSTDYTVMVNGRDGVWSWNGGAVQAPGPVGVTSLSNTNPAVCTVSPTDIGKFANGMAVTIAGAAGAGMTVANGQHYISSVGAPANTFTLTGVDTSGGAAPQTIGVIATATGSMQQEIVTAPPTDPWVSVAQLNIVMAHMNRLFFADNNNLAFYYLPLQAKGGVLGVFPLNAIFKRGGSISAMYTWTTEGAVNLNDQLVIFTTNGEAAIFSGVSPEAAGDFELAGLFRFDSPMSKHCVINYGGELYCLISTGLVPMSTVMRAESEQLGQSDRNVFSNFSQTALKYRDRPGWQVQVNPSSGRVICNMPQGGVEYSQMVRFMPNPIWASWSNLKSRCWGWVDNRLFIGTDDGRVLEMHPDFLNDNGEPIRVDVQAAWSNYGTPNAKQFKMILPYIQCDGTPRPYVDMKVDYDTTPPTNQPETTKGDLGAQWDTAAWALTQTDPPNGAFWAQSQGGRNYWQGVGIIGRVGGPRLVALISNANFSLTGWDVMFERGSPLG